MNYSASATTFFDSTNQTDNTPHSAASSITGTDNASAELYAPPKTALSTLIGYMIVAGTLWLGWMARSNNYLTAKNGLGYALGIIGGCLMVSLLLYPVRKKFHFMRHMGNTKHWFRFHMFAGVMGPVCVLFHANFHFGSINSSIVMVSTLIVTGSGFIGKYIYTKIHYGLYGRRISLFNLQSRLKESNTGMGLAFTHTPHLHAIVSTFESNAHQDSENERYSPGNFFLFSIKKRAMLKSVINEAKCALVRTGKRENWSESKIEHQCSTAVTQLRKHYDLVVQIAEFSFFERLFSWWHILHFPLFCLLVMTGIVHVLAVHMY